MFFADFLELFFCHSFGIISRHIYIYIDANFFDIFSRVIPGTPNYGSGMGIVWEAYHKGVPLLEVRENPMDIFRNTMSLLTFLDVLQKSFGASLYIAFRIPRLF